MDSASLSFHGRPYPPPRITGNHNARIWGIFGLSFGPYSTCPHLGGALCHAASCNSTYTPSAHAARTSLDAATEEAIPMNLGICTLGILSQKIGLGSKCIV